MIGAALTLLRRLEDAVLVTLLTGMIGVATAQVVLRNFFDSGLYWGDSAVRVLVLWVALVGAMVASREDEHIRIDIVGRYLSDAARKPVSRLVSLFTAAVLGVFAWYSAQFVWYEYQDETIAFGSVPAWMCEAVMPVAALLMAIRYLLHVVNPK